VAWAWQAAGHLRRKLGVNESVHTGEFTMPELVVPYDAPSAEPSPKLPTASTTPVKAPSTAATTTTTAVGKLLEPHIRARGMQVAAQVILFSYPSEGLNRLRTSRVCFAAPGVEWSAVRQAMACAMVRLRPHAHVGPRVVRRMPPAPAAEPGRDGLGRRTHAYPRKRRPAPLRPLGAFWGMLLWSDAAA